MKLSIRELNTLIANIEHTPYRPLPPAIARIKERLKKNRKKKSRKAFGYDPKELV